jgi:hypothetical protein
MEKSALIADNTLAGPRLTTFRTHSALSAVTFAKWRFADAKIERVRCSLLQLFKAEGRSPRVVYRPHESVEK